MIGSRLLAAAVGVALLTGVAEAQTPPAVKPAASTSPNPAIQQAIDELNKNNLAEAIRILNKAAETDKLLEPARVIIAKILYQTGVADNIQRARQLLEEAGAEDEKHPDPLLLSGLFALNEGRLLDACSCFESALAKAADVRFTIEQRQRFNKNGREGLAQAYTRRNMVLPALDQYLALLADYPKNAQYRKQAARLMFLRQNFEAAHEALKQAYTDDPKDPAIGLPELNMAALWDSRPFDRANLKVEQEKNRKMAEEWYQKGLAAHAKDVRAARIYGAWLLGQGRIDEADKQIAAAKAIDPNDNESNALMGLSFRYKKQHAEAEKIFSALTVADRVNIIYQWNLALVMAESANTASVKTAVDMAKQIAQGSQQRNPEAWAVLAWCLYKQGNYNEADTAIQNSIRLNTNVPLDSAYYFACIKDKLGKPTEARDMLKSVVESPGPFVNRKDAEALYKALIEKHGPVPPPKDADKDPKEPKKP